MSRYKIDPFLYSNEEKEVLKALRLLNTPLKISRKTNIPRPTVYYILEKLKTRGLVKKETVGKKSVWLLKTTHETAQTSEITTANKNLKIYDSPELIVDFFYRFVQGTERFQFFSGDHNPKYWGKYVKTDDGVKLNNMIRDNNLVSDVFSSTNFISGNENVLGREWTDAFVDKPTEYHPLDSKYTDFTSQIILQNGKVFLLNMKKPVIFEISDEDICKCLASILEFIKDHTEKRSLGDVVKSHTS